MCWVIYKLFLIFISTKVLIYFEKLICFIVVFLGDLFDEGLWSNESDFNSYVETFKRLFSVPKEIKLYVVVGNHDIGFHYRYVKIMI